MRRLNAAMDEGVGRSAARAALLVGAASLVAAVFSGAVAAAPAADRDDALSRYAPVLRYSADEDFYARPVGDTAGDTDLVYGHEVSEDGETYLQYWLFYAYNDQDRGILRTGRHEGDWEFVQVRLGPDGAPAAMTFAQHSVAERCGWGEIETTPVDGDAVPVVYVANGSHAAYPRAGTADRPWPDPNDVADGEGVEVRPQIKAITDEHPAWVQRSEPWGDSEAGWVPGENSSPVGPLFKADERWQQPAAFEAAARACGEPPPGRVWQAPAMAAVALSLLAGVGLLIRRRRG